MTVTVADLLEYDALDPAVRVLCDRISAGRMEAPCDHAWNQGYRLGVEHGQRAQSVTKEGHTPKEKGAT